MTLEGFASGVVVERLGRFLGDERTVFSSQPLRPEQNEVRCGRGVSGAISEKIEL
jgi:hypothetical protein